jgi:hypothetical protein
MVMKDRLFYLGIGLLFTHELDAMTHHEWRVLPLTSWLGEEVGRFVFVAAHVPLFAILIALMASLNSVVRNRTRVWLSAFLILHSMLHAGFVLHDKYEFSSLLSNVLIYGAAMCGLLYLLLHRWERRGSV